MELTFFVNFSFQIPSNLREKLIFSNLDSSLSRWVVRFLRFAFHSLIYAKYSREDGNNSVGGEKGRMEMFFCLTHLLPNKLFAQPGTKIHDFQFGRLENAILGEFHVRLPLVPLHGHVLQVPEGNVILLWKQHDSEVVFIKLYPEFSPTFLSSEGNRNFGII